MNNLSNALDQIGDICTKMLASYETFAKQHGISHNELAILYALWVNEKCTQKQIADEHLIAKQTIHTLCKKYEMDGIITITASDTDKREKMLYFTDKGKAFAKPIIEKLLNQENDVIEHFGHEQMAFLLNKLTQLQQLLAQKLEQS